MHIQRGFSLIEVLVGLAIVGILGTAIPSALSVAIRSATTVDQHTMAESLARSQMDYIQSQTYDSDNITPVYSIIPNLPTPYSIVTPMAIRLDPKNDGTNNDDGLQKITVAVKHGGDIIFTLIDFKVNYNP